MINKNNENITEATVASVEKARELLQTSIESIEKVAKLQLDASRRILDETSDALKQITTVDNPKDFFDKVSQLASHSVENNMGNCRELYEVVQEVQLKISKMIEESIQASQQNVQNAVEGFSNFNPSSFGNTHNMANESVKNWMNAANQAMANLQKVAGQMQDSFKAAATATTETAKKATTKK